MTAVFEVRANEKVSVMRNSAMPRPLAIRRGAAIGEAHESRIAKQQRDVADRAKVMSRIAARKQEVLRRAALGQYCLESCTVADDVTDDEWIGCSSGGLFVHDRCMTNVPAASLNVLKLSPKPYHCVPCVELDSRKRRKHDS